MAVLIQQLAQLLDARVVNDQARARGVIFLPVHVLSDQATGALFVTGLHRLRGFSGGVLRADLTHRRVDFALLFRRLPV